MAGGGIGPTYGEKPLVFKFDGDGEGDEYMIGSEVGNYLKCYRGALYKRYPGLTRRTLTTEERRKLVEMGHSQHVTASSISLLLASEVEDLLAGNEEKYRGGMYMSERASGSSTAGAAAGGDRTAPASGSSTPSMLYQSSVSKSSKAKAPSFVPNISNSSHLDAVPQPTPINRNRVVHKKVKTLNSVVDASFVICGSLS